MKTSSVLHISHLQAAYGPKVALDVTRLDLGLGLHVVLGPNGAGKTTLFRVIAGVLPPLRGEVQIFGVNPYKDASVKSRVGYLPHRPGFLEGARVIDEFWFWSRFMGVSNSVFPRRLEEVVSKLGISPLLPKRVENLSRGQKQLIMLARVLLQDPKVFILDEPTTGLDPEKARIVRDLAKQLSSTRVILYSTHNLYEAKELATEVLFMNKGRIAFMGPLGKIQGPEHKIHRLRIRVLHGDKMGARLLQIARESGFDVEEKNGYFLVVLAKEEDAPSLLRKVVNAGLEVVEVCGEGNPLEEAFLKLLEESRVTGP